MSWSGRPRTLCGLLLVAAVGCAGTQAAERSLRAARRVEVDADGMVEIRGGRLRGPDGATVQIAAFALGVTEVTVAEYRRCVAAGACAPAGRSMRGCNQARLYVEEHPMNCVSPEEAEAYCRWRGARLPTRDEWQWAAQGRGQARRYVWGNYPRRRPFRSYEWFKPFVCGGPQFERPPWTRTCTVGLHDRSRDGVADLGGNVSEWVRAEGGVRAVGQSFVYPFIVTTWSRKWTMRHIEAADTIRRTLATDQPRAADPEVGFRCARSRTEER